MQRRKSIGRSLWAISAVAWAPSQLARELSSRNIAVVSIQWVATCSTTLSPFLYVTRLLPTFFAVLHRQKCLDRPSLRYSLRTLSYVFGIAEGRAIGRLERCKVVTLDLLAESDRNMLSAFQAD